MGEDAGDPVFCVTDLLIHLAGKQMGKKASEVVEGEDLDILIGNRPLVIEKDEADGDAAAGADPAATEADAADRPVYELSLIHIFSRLARSWTLLVRILVLCDAGKAR